MAKRKVHEVDPKEKYEIIGDFFDLVLNLKSKKEVIDFFVGLMTASEILMAARRIQIAKLLIEDEGYEEIRKKLKVGSQTVFRADNWLHGKGEEHNNWIIKCIRKIEEKKRGKTRKNFEYSESLLDKYPGHRFLKEILGSE